MRVLLVDVNCKYSSTGKIVYDLYSRLNENGHVASVAYGRGVSITEKYIIKISSSIEVYIHALLTRITGLTGYFSPFSTLKLKKWIDFFKPDVIHLHDLHGYFINIDNIVRYIKNKNIPIVWTFHCEFMYTGKCGYAYDCNKWISECHKCPYLHDYPSSLLFDFTRLMYRKKKALLSKILNMRIVTPSKWLSDRVGHSFLKDKVINVIHNSINTQTLFYPRETQRLRNKHGFMNEKIILAIAPDIMSERKGGRHVLALAKEMKNDNCKFVLIGVKDLSEKFDSNIIALPKITDQDELATYYSFADVFVICSKRENFPTVCIEALCCGTPVCGFDEGGTKETAPEPFGKFVNYGDYKALRNVLLETLNVDNIKEKCAKYGKNSYSLDRMYNDYIEQYKILMSKESRL